MLYGKVSIRSSVCLSVCQLVYIIITMRLHWKGVEHSGKKGDRLIKHGVVCVNCINAWQLMCFCICTSQLRCFCICTSLRCLWGVCEVQLDHPSSLKLFLILNIYREREWEINLNPSRADLQLSLLNLNRMEHSGKNIYWQYLRREVSCQTFPMSDY